MLPPLFHGGCRHSAPPILSAYWEKFVPHLIQGSPHFTGYSLPPLRPGGPLPLSPSSLLVLSPFWVPSLILNIAAVSSNLHPRGSPPVHSGSPLTPDLTWGGGEALLTPRGFPFTPRPLLPRPSHCGGADWPRGAGEEAERAGPSSPAPPTAEGLDPAGLL